MATNDCSRNGPFLKIKLECHRVTAKRKLTSLVILSHTCYPFPDVAGSAQGDISWRKA